MTLAPQSVQDVILALTEAYHDLPPALRTAARQIIDHPREVGVESMRTLAQRSSVHPNAYVRLARQIGFTGYGELRDTFRSFVIDGDEPGALASRARWLQELAAKGGTAKIVGSMARAVSGNLEQGFQALDLAGLERICDAILSARRVYVLGLGAAYSLAYQFWYVSRMALGHISLVACQGTQPIDDLALIEKEDLLFALTFQPYRSETMKGVRSAKRRGARVVGITDRVTSPLSEPAEELICCPTRTPQFFESHAAVVGLIETLVALLVGRSGEAARARIDTFHAERTAIGTYEEEQRLGP